MKKIYEHPIIAMLSLTQEDVLTASGEPNTEPYYDPSGGEYWVGKDSNFWGT